MRGRSLTGTTDRKTGALVLKLFGAGLLTELSNEGFRCSELVGTDLGSPGGWVQAVEDQEIAVRVVHGGERGDTLDMVKRGKSIHLVVI